MASGNGLAVHQIVGEHPAKSLDELTRMLAADGFVIVEEFYSTGESQGEIMLSDKVVGKIKVWTPSSQRSQPSANR